MHHTVDNASIFHKELQQYKTDFQAHAEASVMVRIYSETFLCHLHCKRNQVVKMQMWQLIPVSNTMADYKIM
jgi:ribosome-associated toxin RatA of RatAB toxin-antitoxin module